MSCPECGAVSEVVDSRMSGSMVRRRRSCPTGHRFTTYELIASSMDEVEAAAAVAMDAVHQLLLAVERLTPVIPRSSRDARKTPKAA